MNQQTLTLILSIIGCASGLIGTGTGVVALVLHIRNHLRDRPILKLSASMSISTSVQIPQDHLAFELSVVNVGRRVIQITQAGVILPNILSEAEKAKGIPLPSESLLFFLNESSGKRHVLTEKEPHTFRSEPFNLGIALTLPRKNYAFVTDSTGKRHVTEFFVGDMPKQVQKKQQAKKTEPESGHVRK